MEVIYYRHGESGASILDAASVNLNLRQDGRPKGGDGLPAPFTTCDQKVARISVLQEHYIPDETGCSISRSLPGHAELATVRYEAPGTT